jgi:hypothetical protein
LQKILIPLLHQIAEKSPTFHDYLVYRYVSVFADGSEEAFVCFAALKAQQA